MGRITTHKLRYVIMFRYDCRNKCVFSFRNTVSDEADACMMLGIWQFCLHTLHSSTNGIYRPLPSQPKLVLIYQPRRDGRLSWPGVAGWLHNEINIQHWELNPDMVSHLSTKWARCRLTLFIEANALTTTPDHQPLNYIGALLGTKI